MNQSLTRTQTRTIATIGVAVVVLGGLLGGFHLADAEPETENDTAVDAEDTAVGALAPPAHSPALEAPAPSEEGLAGESGGDTTEGARAGEAAPASEPGVDPPSEARDGLTDGPGAGPDPDDPGTGSDRGSGDPADEGRRDGGDDAGGDDAGGPGDEGEETPPMTLPEGALEPDPADVGATPTLPAPPPPVDCDAGHKQGYWSEYATGTSGDVVSFEPFVTDECEGVIVDLAGAVPRLLVDRDPAMDRTVFQLETDDVPAGPIDDHIDFASIPGKWISQAYVVHEDGAISILLYHPDLVDDVAAHIDIDGDRMVLSVRDRRASDPEPYATYGDPPYDARPRGPVDDGLVLETAFDRGGGDLFVSGYAKAPEDSVRLAVNDRGTGWPACIKRLVVPSPTHLYGRFDVTCHDLPAGTYDVVVGWDDPAGGQWYTETVTVPG